MREGETSPIIARRRTHDGLTVLAFSDGYLTFGSGVLIKRHPLTRPAMRLFLDDVGRYDGEEAKTLANAANSAVAKYPDSTILARNYMRSLVGPPAQRNPLGGKDYLFIGAAALSSIAILYEFFKKPSSTLPSTTPPMSPTDTIFSYDGQTVDLPVGHTITTNLIFSPPQAGWRVADTTGTAALAPNPGGIVNSSSSQTAIQTWTAVNPGTEKVTYQAIDKTGADIPGQTMSFTANVSSAVS
jgi:hypothetical protein